MGYWRDPETGIVYLEADNPQAAWTPEEWEAHLAALRARKAALEATTVAPKTAPDQETLDFWNAFHGGAGQELDMLASLLADLEKV